MISKDSCDKCDFLDLQFYVLSIPFGIKGNPLFCKHLGDAGFSSELTDYYQGIQGGSQESKEMLGSEGSCAMLEVSTELTDYY